MATIINNPSGREAGGDSSVGMVFVLLALLVAGILFYTYGLPGRQANDGANITVPEAVDVNVTTPTTPTTQTPNQTP